MTLSAANIYLLLRQHQRKNGVPVDLVACAILRDEWETLARRATGCGESASAGVVCTPSITAAEGVSPQEDSPRVV